MKRAKATPHNDDATARLPQLAREMVKSLLTGDPNHPFVQKHMAPEFLGACDLTRTVSHLDEYLGRARWARARNPNYQPHVRSELVDVDRRSQNAVVWQFAGVTGSPEGLVREVLLLSRWRLEHGVWLCYYFVRYRGNPLLGGPFEPDVTPPWTEVAL